ncbi:Cleft Lip And Palate Transmembrane Protein 1-Like Protein [Manis pentadactyla]|nr:Cleft Lip And Palate Transmembrane Protein 1-Like Protein [Manis pentadactyla]
MALQGDTDPPLEAENFDISALGTPVTHWPMCLSSIRLRFPMSQSTASLPLLVPGPQDENETAQNALGEDALAEFKREFRYGTV